MQIKLKHAIVISVLAVASAGYALMPSVAQKPVQTVTNTGVVAHIGPAYLYPNPQLTPGKADTLSFQDLTARYNGQTYSQAHRNVSNTEKNQVCNEYPDNCKVSNEKDHFYPLCAGGSNDITNLWAQPEVNQWKGEDWGFHRKDKLESWICVQIKAGKLDPKDAFQRLTSDWVKFYQDNKASIEQ